MFSLELQEYIAHGKEEENIEYKSSHNWRDASTKMKIMKAMLALSNYPEGGVIVLGVKQKDDKFVLTGMNQRDYKSFDQDNVGQYVRNHSDPLIRFTLAKDVMPVKNKTNEKVIDKRFCVIQISESLELPVICTQFEVFNKTKPSHINNVCLREGAVYIRTSHPISSREIHSQEEWRDLLYRSIEKIQNRSKVIVSQKVKTKVKKPTKAEDVKFKQKFKEDKLI